MTKEELEKRAKEYARKEVYYGAYVDEEVGMEIAEEAYIEATERETKLLQNRIADLEAQIEKLIDFVLSKTECCDVCPITDTCINSEGTCPYAGILAKGEEEVTREWLMKFISRR